jgi:hypothetical protein
MCRKAFGDAFHSCNMRTCYPLGIRGEKEIKEATGPFIFGFALVGKDIVFRFVIEYTSVACAVGPSVTTRPQQIFPSKTWFFRNLFEYSAVEIT